MEGSCQWILNQPLFEHWSSSHFSEGKAKILWVHGPAGFGKTVLCASMIEHLNSTLESPVADFFFSDDCEREDPFVVMRSWVSQVVLKNSTAFTLAQKRLISHVIRATCTEIMGILRDIVVTIPGCTFIMDGLDESTWVTGNQKAGAGDSVYDLMGALRGIFENTSTRLLVLSRDELEIRTSLQDNFAHEDFLEHRITPTEVRDDIGSYSKRIVDQELKGSTETEREAIGHFLADRCEGQFLWIALQHNYLRRKSHLSQEQIKAAILLMPNKLETVYEQNCKRLAELDDMDRRRCISLLRWVAFSLRPLTVNEITEALLISEESDEVRLHELPTTINESFIQNAILFYCGSLLEIRSPQAETNVGLSTVHLAHFSVKQYLLCNTPMKFRLMQTVGCFFETLENTQLTKMCLRYIYWQSVRPERSREVDRIPKLFFNYAAGHWYRHFSLGETHDAQLVKFVNQLFNIRGPSWSLWIDWFNLTNAEGKKELSIIEEVRFDENDVWINRDPSRFGLVHIQQPTTGHNPAGPLYYAALLGFVDTAEFLITRHKSQINEKGILGRTALLAACKNGHLQVAELLLASGAKFELADDFGWTPLYAASTNGHVGVVKLLVEKGANLEAENNHGWTAINGASTKGHAQVVELLIKKGANFEAKSRDGWSPIYSASTHGHHDVVQLLLKFRASHQAPENEGMAPIYSAACHGHAEVVKLLLVEGVNLDSGGINGYTPLSVASEKGHLEIVKLLSDKRTNMTAVDRKNTHKARSDGWTPLYAAVNNGHLEVVKFLYTHGVDTDIHQVTNYGWTLINAASSNGHLEVVRFLYTHGADADIHTPNNEGWTPINTASSNEHLEIVKFLYTHGADVDIHRPNIEGWTPINAASSNENLEVVNFLYSHGADADIHTPNNEGWTPLYTASSHGHLRIVEFLYNHGADTDIHQPTKYGRTPLAAASDFGHLEVVKFLYEHGASFEVEDSCGRTPLFLASVRGHVEILRELFSYGAVVNTKDRYGSTPIFSTVKNGHQLAVDWFFDIQGASLQLKDGFGHTLLWWAKRCGKTRIADSLIRLAQIRGIELCENDLAVEPSSMSMGETSGRCDACTRLISVSSAFHHCRICNVGNFDICLECFEMGTRCLNNSHELILHQSTASL